ncbi:MAG: C1 family peptidase [Bacteroidales bacterium]|nr:C1 family peptidase [Bacteroidales bacterium]
MPIRIRKDSDASGPQRKIPRQSGGMTSGGGGGGLAGALLPLIINLFKKNPKTAVVLIILAVAGYFILTRTNNQASSAVQSLFFGTGLMMDEEVYDQAAVFEPLADNIKNPLPESVSLLEYCPRRMNQGSQGSCVGWSSAYAARTILHARASGQDPDDVTFSPSYVYNQIALPGCQGTYMQNAMEVMHEGGALPFSNFAYDESSCSKKPTEAEKMAASAFRTKGFNRLTQGGNDYRTDLLAIKQNLAQGAPVVIGMMVGGSFMSDMTGQELWTPRRSDYNMYGFGGHAMCVIGFDDYYEGGAFQVMNSWGEEWGDEGIFWIRYNDFDYFTQEAYGLYPMGDADKVASYRLDVEIGLVVNTTGEYIPLRYNSGITYASASTVNKNTDFKVEITNSLECYTYIFGQETDGSSYVLFPYTAKHSPYCGITGTRLFPKDYSLYPDEVGDSDFIAIVVSVQKLDYNRLNGAINSAPGAAYSEKVYNTLKGELAKDVRFEGGKTIKFSTDITYKGTVAMVLEILK